MKRYRVSVALIFVIVATLLFWLVPWRGSSSEVVLRIGYLPISPAIPFFVALENGYFDDAGIKVEAVKYQNGALMAEELMTGRLAAASPGPADVYLKAETKTPGRFRIYLHTAYTPDNFIYSLVVRKDSGIQSAEDLKGKRIAVFPGVTNKLLFGLFLKESYGWDPESDVSISGVSPALQLDALETGEYDGLCPLEPMGTIGVSRPALVMIDKGPIEREVLNPLYITAHALSTQVLAEYPAELKAFVKAMERAVKTIREDEDTAREVLVKYTSLLPDQAHVTPLGEALTVAEADREQFQRLADLLAAEGVLPKVIDVDTLYYKSHD